MRWKYDWFCKEEHEISWIFLIGKWVGILKSIRDSNSGEWIRPFNKSYIIIWSIIHIIRGDLNQLNLLHLY